MGVVVRLQGLNLILMIHVYRHALPLICHTIRYSADDGNK